MSDHLPAPSRLATAWLLLTAVVCGALVMVIEILGSRVIGPVFGVSLFVWTALITVALLALAIGYALGGFLADRWRNPDILYYTILAAGLFAAATPLLRAPVLMACLPLGLRTGALAASAILFGPALLLLGCVSPWVVRIAATEGAKLGRTVGLLYALSTLGSFVGTLLTGFVLIARFGVDRIFLAVGALLALLAAGHFLLVRRRPAALLLILPLLLLPLAAPKPLLVKPLPSGGRVVERVDRDTYYGRIQVLDFERPSGTSRFLSIDGQIQGGIDLADGASVVAYPYTLELIPRLMRPEGKSCLVIGLGAGVVPKWYESQGVRTDVIEINPLVVELARDYFGFSCSGEVFIGDARAEVQAGDRRYDYVILDVFNGDTTPSHLVSLEALAALKHRIAPGGLLAMNLVGSLERDTYMMASVIRTLRQLFPTVTIHPGFDPTEPFGNITVIAHDGPVVPIDPAKARVHYVHLQVYRSVFDNIGRTFSFPDATAATVLTDDYNPIDVYDIWIKETFRRDIIKGTDPDFLI
jgi:spermidine synthase